MSSQAFPHQYGDGVMSAALFFVLLSQGNPIVHPFPALPLENDKAIGLSDVGFQLSQAAHTHSQPARNGYPIQSNKEDTDAQAVRRS